MQCIMIRDGYKIWHDGVRYAISKNGAIQPSHCAYASMETVLEQKDLRAGVTMSIAQSMIPIGSRVNTPKRPGTISLHEIYRGARPRHGVKLDAPWEVFPHLDPCFWDNKLSPIKGNRRIHGH